MREPDNRASDWAGRIAWIIDQYDGGNITAASRRVGVSQQALSRLIREHGIPRGDTLAALLLAYPRVSADWLVLGRGPRERAEDLGRAALLEIVAAVQGALDEVRRRFGV